MKETQTITPACYHCGNLVSSNITDLQEKYFCCNGCKMVYEILNEHELCTYYDLNNKPGVAQNENKRKDKYAFLEDLEIQIKLIQFSDKTHSHITLYLPQIHCSSCLWLLENIDRVNSGIISSKVNFTKKEVFIVFDHSKTTLRKVVETLDNIGYEPHLSLNDLTSQPHTSLNRKHWYKIGVAGFCFGNIMMLSLADYFSSSGTLEPKLETFFRGLSIILSLPVLFYSSTEFFVSAWSGLKNKYLNIDLPVALALVITFIRSLYEISYGIGSGYLDSMSGIVFFMLIGRWLQSRTYQSISFDRDYKSFFPIALNSVKNGIIIPTEISKIKKNDVIQIYANEIIPVDAILSKGKAKIDYSFVSGESLPVNVTIGEMIYAGGKQLDGLLELIVVKEVSQSYLTNLWNNQVFNKKERITRSNYDTLGKYFTYVVLILGFGAGLYWYLQGQSTLMWNAITTVLIVACPCALLLSQNYTNGNILRVFGLNKFYLRSADVIEKLSKINHIVLDKTGTITQNTESKVNYIGREMDEEQKLNIASLLQQSSHPASKLISKWLKINDGIKVDHFKETEGGGIAGWINEHYIKIGSSAYVGGEYFKEKRGTKVVVLYDNVILGEFIIANSYRLGVSKLIPSLRKNFALSLVSGDNDAELKNIQHLFGKESDIEFNQSPQQKLDYIKHLQSNSKLSVMMIGDGLNDAGALKQSNVGIAVSDTSNNFTPSSDGVIDGSQLFRLDVFLRFAKESRKIILFSFSVSAVYNFIGLYFAIQGILSPVIAAILMPASSITIILMTYGLTELMSHGMGLKINTDKP